MNALRWVPKYAITQPIAVTKTSTPSHQPKDRVIQKCIIQATIARIAAPLTKSTTKTTESANDATVSKAPMKYGTLFASPFSLLLEYFSRNASPTLYVHPVKPFVLVWRRCTSPNSYIDTQFSPLPWQCASRLPDHVSDRVRLSCVGTPHSARTPDKQRTVNAPLLNPKRKILSSGQHIWTIAA